MPVETQQLGTAALGSWAAIRMKTQVLPQMTGKCEKNSFLFGLKKLSKYDRTSRISRIFCN